MDAILPVPPAPVPDDAPPSLDCWNHARNPVPTSPFPLWVQILLARVTAGLPLDQARLLDGSMVSPAIIERARQTLPGFAQALDLARTGVAVLGEGESRGIARALSSNVLVDAYQESRNRDPETGEPLPGVPVVNRKGEVVGYRDAVPPMARVANRRLVAEAGSLIGGPTVVVPVQVNVGVSRLDAWRGGRPAPASPATDENAPPPA